MISLVFLTACSSSQPIKIAEVPELSTHIPVTVLWQASVGSAGRAVFTPAVVQHDIYTASQGGEVTRFELGREIWRQDVGSSLSGGVGSNGKLVVVGNNKGKVFALDNQGKLLWEAQVSSEVLSAPQVAKNIVIVRTGDSKIFGLDANTGQRKWLYQHSTPALTVRSHASVMLMNDLVFVGFAGGKIVALTLDKGTVVWEGTVSTPKGATELERVTDITSLPVVDNRQVCVVSYQGRVTCFDTRNGNQQWARDMSSISGVSLDEKYLYVSDDKGAIHALDRDSGASIWKQDKLLNRNLTAPLPIGSYLAVGDLKGYVHFLSREDGSFVGRYDTDGSPILANLQYLDTGFLVQTQSGGLYALSVQ